LLATNNHSTTAVSQQQHNDMHTCICTYAHMHMQNVVKLNAVY